MVEREFCDNTDPVGKTFVFVNVFSEFVILLHSIVCIFVSLIVAAALLQHIQTVWMVLAVVEVVFLIQATSMESLPPEECIRPLQSCMPPPATPHTRCHTAPTPQRPITTCQRQTRVQMCISVAMKNRLCSYHGHRPALMAYLVMILMTKESNLCYGV